MTSLWLHCNYTMTSLWLEYSVTDNLAAMKGPCVFEYINTYRSTFLYYMHMMLVWTHEGQWDVISRNRWVRRRDISASFQHRTQRTRRCDLNLPSGVVLNVSGMREGLNTDLLVLTRRFFLSYVAGSCSLNLVTSLMVILLFSSAFLCSLFSIILYHECVNSWVPIN